MPTNSTASVNHGRIKWYAQSSRTLRQRHITAGRKQLHLEAEEVEQHRRQPEHRHRNPHQRKDCQGTVGEPACMHGAQVAEHDRQRHPQHRRSDAQRERGGQPLPYLLDDVAVLRVGRQLAGEDLLHHRQVLDGQWLVEPEIGADPGDQRRVGVLACDPGGRVGVRDDVEDQEHDHRDREQHRDHSEQAPGDEAGHRLMLQPDLRLRVHRVAEAVAEYVQRQHRCDDHQPGHDGEMWCREDHLIAVGDHAAP